MLHAVAVLRLCVHRMLHAFLKHRKASGDCHCRTDRCDRPQPLTAVSPAAGLLPHQYDGRLCVLRGAARYMTGFDFVS